MNEEFRGPRKQKYLYQLYSLLKKLLIKYLQQQYKKNMSHKMIGDPEKFQLASIVTKNSRTGITSNKRLLVVRAGHLYYYSNVPKSFTGDNFKILEQFHQLPKCSIEIININRINGFEPSSSYFSIQFQAKNMLQRQDIRKTLINEDYNFTPKNTKELVTWQFTCDNQFIKQKWVSSLQYLKEHFKTQQINMQKYFQSLNQPQPEEVKSSNGSYSSRSSLKVSPWRESVASRKSYTLDNAKYGFQFRQGSPKQSSNKLQDPQFLKKGKSEDPRTFPQFQMIIKQQPKQSAKIEEVFKLHQIKKVEQPVPPPPAKQTILFHPTPIIEQSAQQTPIKENSYSDSEDHLQYRASMEKTLNDLKLFSEHKTNYSTEQPSSQNNQNYQIIIPTLPIVEEKPELKKSKHSAQFSLSPRSNIQQKYEQIQQKIQKQPQHSKTFIVGSQQQWFLAQSCKSSAKFEYRIEKQKELLNLVQMFKHRAMNSFSSWLQSKSNNQQRYQVTEQSNHFKLVDAGNIQLKVATLTTQNITINGKQKIFFNEEGIKNLKRQFKIYQNLFKLILKKMKHSNNFNLRVPLAIYIEYKGVTCIAFDQSQIQTSVELNDDTQQWPAEKSAIVQQGYKLQWFNFKTVNGYLFIYLKTRGKNIQKDDQNLKEYLKKIIKIGSAEKNHNIIFQSPIDKTFLEIAFKQRASTSVESLQRYVKGLKLAKVLHGNCPKQQIISALQYCLYCKQLRKIYRSAQGEIDQTHFFNLIFKGDPSIATLLQQSNCPMLTNIKGQLFSFIQYYFGVILQIDQKIFTQYYLTSSPDKIEKRKKKDIFFSATVSPLIRQYAFSQLQIIESYSKLTQYLQSRHHLTEPALEKKKQIFHLFNENQQSMSLTLQLLYDEASFFYYESDYIGCIKKCKQYEQTCPHQYTKLFSIYLLMMKAYSQFSQADFSLTLRKATELIQYNYGLQHSSLISLLSLAGFYYSKLSQKPNSSKQVDLSIVAVKLMKKAEELCLKHFGRSSKQYLDILLDLSRINRRVDQNSAIKYTMQAKKICEQNVSLANPQNIISLLTYETQFYLQTGNLPQAQSSLLNALAYIDSKISHKTKKHIIKLQYQLGFYLQKYNYCEAAVERLWAMSSTQKVEAVQLAYKAALRESGIPQSENLIDENDSVRFEGRSKSLIQLQKIKQQYGNLIQMITNAIEQKNTRLLTMIYYLNRN